MRPPVALQRKTSTVLRRDRARIIPPLRCAVPSTTRFSHRLGLRNTIPPMQPNRYCFRVADPIKAADVFGADNYLRLMACAPVNFTVSRKHYYLISKTTEKYEDGRLPLL